MKNVIIVSFTAVAPFTGAWIEIGWKYCYRLHEHQSHPSRVRGLKSPERVPDLLLHQSHPSRVRGLKLLGTDQYNEFGDCRTLHGCVD